MTSIQPIRAKAWDLVLSIIFGVLAIVMAVLAAFFEFVEVAFTDNCDDQCHPGVGIAGVFLIDAIVAILVIVAIVITIRRLLRHKTGWWVMLIAFLVVILGAVGAYLLYAASVGFGTG